MIEYGNDIDGDRGLDDDEVTGSNVVCNGRDDDTGCSVTENEDGSATITCADGTRVSVADGLHGKPALARVEEEPAGERCIRGGANVHAGIDTDDDGVLSDDEVTSVQTLCSGEVLTGVALVRMDPEPFGVNCPVGGTAVKSGVDTNDDGELDDGEVLQTAYVCNGPPVVVEDGVLRGDYHIETSLDVALLAGVREITGSLTLGGGGNDTFITEVSLPMLERVDGDLDFWSDSLVTLGLPSVESTGGNFGFTAPLETLTLGSVQAVGAFLGFSGAHVGDLQLDTIASGITGISINNCDAITSLPGFAWIRTLEHLYVHDNAQLPRCYAERILDQLDEEPRLVDIDGNGEGECE